MKRNTLFGTTLERKDLSDIPYIETNIVNYDNNDCDENDPLTSARNDYEQHKNKLDEMDKVLKLKEYDSRFNETIHGGYQLPKFHLKHNSNQMTSDKSNMKVGSLNTITQTKFTDNKPSVQDKALEEIIKRHIAQKRNIKDIRAGQLSNKIYLEKSQLEIPRNICHRYRYSFCDDTLFRENSLKKLKPKDEDVKENKGKKQITEFPLSEYNYLGIIIRSNVFPSIGLPGKQITSYNKCHDGWDTFKRRDTSLPTQYRFQSDELSKWSTASIVEQRVFKEWQNKYDAMLKHKPTV